MKIRGDLIVITAGYLLGGILFAKVFGKLFHHRDIAEQSRDRNPGTANAYRYGGFLCGTLTLLGDVTKGFIPVFLYLRWQGMDSKNIALAFVLAAPVAGHIFPLFSHFKGGKGIATTFGCLLRLLPYYPPVLILAAAFVFFSAVLRINPHYRRTSVTYILALVLMIVLRIDWNVVLGFAIITAMVFIRLKMSSEEKEKMKVRLFWMH